MNLLVKRQVFAKDSTIGEMYIDGKLFGYTLEDVVRDKKIPGETAIPTGTYKVVIDYSNHFKRDLPHVLDVPEFEGIRIHPGNSDKDTEGCILVGDSYKADWITNSRVTFDKLFQLMKQSKDEIILTIE